MRAFLSTISTQTWILLGLAVIFLVGGFIAENGWIIGMSIALLALLAWAIAFGAGCLIRTGVYVLTGLLIIGTLLSAVNGVPVRDTTPETSFQWPPQWWIDWTSNEDVPTEAVVQCTKQNWTGGYSNVAAGYFYDCAELAQKLGIPVAPAGSSNSEAALNPMPEAGAQTTDYTNCVEDVLAATSFTDREAATVNGMPVDVQVRGKCPQPLFYDPTGIEDGNTTGGQNYTLHLPAGWTAIPLGVSVAVHAEGGSQIDYTTCPFVRIDGPFDGSVGIYEGAMRITTTEWAEGLIDQVLPIHSAQCKFDVPITTFVNQP